MAVIEVAKLSEALGIKLDESDPIASLKEMKDALEAKSAENGELSEGLKASKTALDNLLSNLAGTTGNPGAPAQKADEEPNRQLQDDLARAKVLPSAAELPDILARPPQDDTEKALQDFNDTLYLLSAVKRVPVKSLKFYKDSMERSPRLKTSYTGLDGQSGYGAEWNPTGFSGQVFQDLRQQCLVGNNLVQIAMPTATYKLPYQNGTTSAYVTSQLTDRTASRFGTAADTMTAVGIGCAMWFSQEEADDSIAAIMPLVRADMSTTLAEGVEAAVLYGDSDGTHHDSDIQAISAHAAKAWNGYRKLCLAQAATYLDCSAIDTPSTIIATCRALRKKMGKYGANPADLMWVTGTAGAMQLMNAPEILTMEKYGSAATLVTGELARLDGIPIVPSGQVRENLSSAGIYDAAGTKTCLHLINKRYGVMGTYKGVTIQDDMFILAQAILVVANVRAHFVPRIAIDATHPSAVLGINIAA